jgi:hypothetical protein
MLKELPSDKAFYFYLAENSPLGLVAKSLGEFSLRLRTVDSKSLEFHTNRGDFEKWLLMLGDQKLAQQIAGLRKEKLQGEGLRRRLSKLVNNRYSQLQKQALASF